jgi:hypothetical protein
MSSGAIYSVSPRQDQLLKAMVLPRPRCYWHRLWIIQEIVLSCDIRIQCGTEFAEWYQMYNLLDYIDKTVRSTMSHPAKTPAP